MIELSVNSIDDAIKDFDKKEHVSEEALNALFSIFYSNSSEAEVLVKVIALNQLYSTRLLIVGNEKSKTINVHSMARHIAEQPELDMWMHSNRDCLRAYEYIAAGTGEYNRCDSFASKYCSWHNQELYPIMDRYARGALYNLATSPDNTFWEGKRVTRKELLVYSVYRDMVFDFQKYLKSVFKVEYTIKGIDKFLWWKGNQNKQLAF